MPNTYSLRRRLLRAFVLYVVVPYLAVLLLFTVFQRKLLYRPTVTDDLRVATLAFDPESIRDVQLETPDGETLRGWLLAASGPQATADAPLVVYFPGNSLNRQDRVHDLRELARPGFDVLIFDYRGYGDSTGSPSETTLSADARLVWQFAVEKLGQEEGRIVVFGESLGGAVALSLWAEDNATPPEPAAVILNSTFASMPRLVGEHYPWFPFRYLLFDRWMSVEQIGKVSAPITIFHGTADEMIPAAHGQALAQAASHARFVEIEGGSHNGVPTHELRNELDRIRETMRNDE